MKKRIEDYAMIGDCESGALVHLDGSIDWLCWPRFDSPACFAALLGTRDNGRWQLAPLGPVRRIQRRYRENTLVLETRYQTADGVVTVVDFMPPRDGVPDLVRLVIGERGRVRMRTELIMRFGYGATVPWVTRHRDDALHAVAGPDMIVVRADVPLHGEELKTVGEFEISAGERVAFTISYGPSHLRPPRRIDPLRALRDTENFWRDWIGRCRYEGEWWDAVARSLLTLKALTFQPTGGVVAALTTSLPECIGGSRNWDYRYCWLRDATLTLLALVDAGYYDEAAAWRDWLLRAAAGSPSQVQIMYGVAGERHLLEWEVPWLRGFERSTPVRVGNAAAGQLQLDVFGEVLDVLFHARREGEAPVPEAWRLEQALLRHLQSVADKPDHGMWEVRGPPQHFTHSKMMAWVAVDRAIRSATMFRLDAPLDRWRAWQASLHAEICREAWNPKIGAFAQSYGSGALDASLLMMPVVGFLPARDPRVRGTVAAIERHLTRDGLVYRYNTDLTDDGLPPGEGAFIACSFWLADNYSLAGRHDEARKLFERLASLRNDVGLLAEEYDPVARRQLGNFPQAFSHVALVNTALNLTRDHGGDGRPARQRSGRADSQGR